MGAPASILHGATTGTDAAIYFFIFRPFSLINKDSFISTVRPFLNELNSKIIFCNTRRRFVFLYFVWRR